MRRSRSLLVVSLRFVAVVSTFAICQKAVHAAALTRDANFQPPDFSEVEPPLRAATVPGAKVLLFSNVNTLADQRGTALTRFLADGTLDTSFHFSSDYADVSAVTALADGRTLAAARQSIYGAPLETRMLRLNADGSIDSTFASSLRTTGVVNAIAVQPDGNILVVGFFKDFGGLSRQGIVRLLPSGALDPTFSAVTMQFAAGEEIGGVGGVWTMPVLQSDGKILIGGNFSTIDGVAVQGVARLNTDGSLDSNFLASGFSRQFGRPVRGLVLQADGKIVIASRFTVSSTFASNHTGAAFGLLPCVRLNSDGTADQSYGYYGAPFFWQERNAAIQGNGKVITVGGAPTVERFNNDGSLDSSFHPPQLMGAFATSYSVTVLPSAKILIGGSFANAANAGSTATGSQFGAALLNSDGTVDTAFNTSHKTAQTLAPSSFARQLSERTLIAFNRVSTADLSTAIPHNFGRLLPDGSLDSSFDPFPSYDPQRALTPDFLAGGVVPLPNTTAILFGTGIPANQNVFPPETYPAIGRIFADGTEDTSFPRYQVATDDVFPLSTGQLLVTLSAATSQTAQAVINAAELTRLNPAGNADQFQVDPKISNDAIARNGSAETVACGAAVLAALDGGKILFSYLAANSSSRLVRLNADGTVDSTFPKASTSVETSSSIVFASDQGSIDPSIRQMTALSTNTPGFADAESLPNGQIVVVGSFTTYNGVSAHGIVRLNANGTVDGTFLAGNGAQWISTPAKSNRHPRIDNIERLSDGKFVITGSFEAFDGTPAPGIARLNSNGSLDTSVVAPVVRQKFDPTRAVLKRQPDGSLLLSGPYSASGSSGSPSFFRLIEPAVALNISTRALVQTGDNVLIGGLIVTGSDSKKVIIRGGGPSLASANISGYLADPTLELRDAAGSLLASNDNWKTGQQQPQILATGVAPANDLEPALIATLNPNQGYTAIIRGKGVATGIALIEVYDLQPSASSQLANISTRSFVGTGNDVLIGGFIVGGGTTYEKVIVRAIGPSLAGSGIQNPLANPVLALHDGNGTLVASNDNWKQTQENEITASGIPPKNDLESALVTTLAPGGYTAVVSGSGQGTGVALVEVYNLQ